MRSIFRWVIPLVLIGGVLYFISMEEFDLEQFYKWEIIVTVIFSIVIWLIFQWRRAMRLEKMDIHLQFLDD